MSVVDYLLNSLVKKLQKTQKARKKRKEARRKVSKKPRKTVKSKVVKKTVSVKRKTAALKRKAAKKPVKKAPKKTIKKSVSAKKKKTLSRPKAKSKTVQKVKKPAAKVSAKEIAPKEICIGEITHYFSRIQVVVVKMTYGSLSVGDQIHIKGKGADFTQKAGSLQIESVDVKTARKGQLVGLKVNKVVKVGDKVYK